MIFSSVSFLYYFFPIVIFMYFIAPTKLKNVVLLLSSLAFYFFGEPVYIVVMIGAALSGYIHGLLIEKYRGTKLSKAFLVSSIVFGALGLVVFKYVDFLIENFNGIFSSNIALFKLAIPIGISFYTFQILSYTIDLYNGKAGVQKNFLDFATYVMLFPQLIAGPIVRYTDVENELKNRKHSFEKFSYGVNRFIIGLSKKVLIANVLGEFCKVYKQTETSSVLFVWAYAIAYALHIYFDFSGYSDMAIGIGRIFGFHFPENFNYPYISKSVTEFWRRWHITLGSWFRDYIYIPLGGNRVSKLKWFRNILIVWGLTGFWHGAGWNFIIWGLMFAVLLILEKFLYQKTFEKIPTFFSRVYVIVMILFSWVIFDAESIQIAMSRIGAMLGQASLPFINEETIYYISSYALVFVLAMLGSMPLVKNIIKKVKTNSKLRKVINIAEPIVHIAMLIVVTAYLIDGSFNPFLYFRF